MRIQAQLALCVKPNSTFPRRDCGVNSLVEIEGLSAGIVEGWEQQGVDPKIWNRGLDLAARAERRVIIARERLPFLQLPWLPQSIHPWFSLLNRIR